MSSFSLATRGHRGQGLGGGFPGGRGELIDFNMKSSINRRSGAWLFQFYDDHDDDDGGEEGRGSWRVFWVGGLWGGLCPVSEATGDKKNKKKLPDS